MGRAQRRSADDAARFEIEKRRARIGRYLGGFTTLIEADLQGLGDAKTQPAIFCDSNMMARDVQTRGYQKRTANPMCPIVARRGRRKFRAMAEQARGDACFPARAKVCVCRFEETPASPRESDIDQMGFRAKFGAVPMMAKTTRPGDSGGD